MLDVHNNPEILRRIPLFRSLPEDALQRLLHKPENGLVVYSQNELIFSEGDYGDCMYVIVDGSVNISVVGIEADEVVVATLNEGDHFGEQALLEGNPDTRNATAKAAEGATLFRISRHDVENAISYDPEYFRRYAEHTSSEQSVQNLLKGIRLFRCLMNEDYRRMDEWAEIIELGPGQLVVREQAIGDNLYVIMEGQVEVFIVDSMGQVVVLHTLSRGNYFGEQALLPDSDGKRNANVRTVSSVKLVKVPKQYFRNILSRDDRLQTSLRLLGEAQINKISQYLRS